MSRFKNHRPDSAAKSAAAAVTFGRHASPRLVVLTLVAMAGLIASGPPGGNGVAVAAERKHVLDLEVTSSLPSGKVPFDPLIDFPQIIADAGIEGVLDPNSIEVINQATGEVVPVSRHEDFAYGDRGRLQWVIQDPAHRHFQIHFRTVDRRPAWIPQNITPPVGVGDLWRYNAGEPRPIAMPYPARLVDLTGDGKPDYVGCWNYAYRPGMPWSGIICYPAVGDFASLQYGDRAYIRYGDDADGTNFQHCSKIYMTADFADLNGDGLVDYVYCPSGDTALYVYLNSGRRDAGGMPVFVAAGSLARHTSDWNPCRVVDLDGNGLLDFVVGNVWIKNIGGSTRQWPMQLDTGVALDLGAEPCFYDVDGDGRLDSVCLEDVADVEGLSNHRVCWRRNVSESSASLPQFAPATPLDGVDAPRPRSVIPVQVGGRRGFFVSHDHYQNTTFFAQSNEQGTPPRFASSGRVQSPSAVLSLGDQAWPCVCDWDDDGDLDLLVGGGYGWPRILINHGTKQSLVLSEAQYILAEGQPIRITRNEVLGPPDNWHDMGYSYPVYVDWDADALPDLMLPNETNRIFWHKNIGTRPRPEFGPRQQVICDDYPDSPELRTLSATRAADTNSNNGCYPYEQEQPFFWRTGAAFADWNGDGLMDLVTHDGHTRKATLFTQYRAADGQLRLRKDHPLQLSDGRPIDDSLVNRASHWTESFRPVDWDGDGLTDILYSLASGAIPTMVLLKNVGGQAEPVFAPPRTMSCFGEPITVTSHGPHPFVGDVDGDGKPDILTCVEWSVYPFYSHNALEMPSRPTYTLAPLSAP